ncbi:MAG: hypothetical protein ABJK43_18750, partial [Lentilitoribacter sp.]
MSLNITDDLIISLTSEELTLMETLLDSHDRGGFYMVYSAMTGSDEAALQARVATFSGPVGGAAFAANRLLQEWYGPGSGASPEYAGIYKLSQLVAESGFKAIKDNITEDNGPGVVDDLKFYTSAEDAWSSQSQIQYFPGNLLEPISQATNVVGALLNYLWDTSVGAILLGGGTPDPTELLAAVGNALDYARNEALSDGMSPGSLAAFLATLVYDNFGKTEADLLAAGYTKIPGPDGYDL